MSTEKHELEQTFADMCVLYELALASGTSLDLRQTCRHFLSVLAARKGFSYCGVWLRSDRIPSSEAERDGRGLELIYGAPRSHIRGRKLELVHPAWTRIGAGPFSVVNDASFAGIAGEGGAYTVFPLGEFGLLTLHSKRRSEPLDRVALAQLAGVVRSFAAAVDRCITHEHLVLEVAERERAERENLSMQLRLRHAQKLEAVGRLAGGIAHDFNNLLMSILSTVELIQLDAEDPQLLEDLSDIEAAGQRAAELTRQLLTFARPPERKREEAVDLDELVLEVAKLLRRTFDRNIELETRVSLGGRKVCGTASALHTVLMNLAINARDAMPEGGALLIETDASPSGLGERGGEFVALRVSDNGQGMSEEVRERIFDPFFTTKERGRGTGLGLATVYGIIKSHKGEIRVSSRVGEGTTFEVLLPLLQAALEPEPEPARSAETPPGPDSAAAKPLAPAAPPPQPRHGLILLIDDGEGPRPTTAAVLERIGYEVTLAKSARRTLELADAHSGLHAAIVSLRSVDKGKLDTLAQLRNGLPTLPVVTLEGTPGASAAQFERLALSTPLAKGFDLHMLRDAIARARVAALHRPWDR